MKKNSLNPYIPYDKSLREMARKLRSNLTPAEIKFWTTLRIMPFYKQYYFNRQKPLGGFIVDFYCHSLRLVIEIDGDTHSTDSAESYDQKRTRWLEDQGLQVIRFLNHDVLNEINGVMETLERIIEKILAEESPQPPSLRQAQDRLRRGS